MTYNLSFMDSANSTADVVAGVSTLTGGWFWSFVLFGLFLVVFIGFSHFDRKMVFVADSFICSVVGILLFYSGLIGFNIMVYPIIMFVISLVYAFVLQKFFE